MANIKSTFIRLITKKLLLILLFSIILNCSGIIGEMYLKDGKFVEPWMGTLKERTVFQDILDLKIGGYQINSDDSRLYAWTTKYVTKISTNTLMTKPTTIVSIFNFDGAKYVLQSQDTCEQHH